MNSKLPQVSIVVPAFNCAEYVAETFQSVVAQDFTDWEIIFVNDGSTDNTAEVLDSLAAQDSRVVVVRQENGRQGKARNHGISKAQAEWVAFLDADDLWPSNKLSQQLSITQKANADLSFTNGYICLNNEMSLRQYQFGVKDEIFLGEDGVQQFHGQNKIPTSSVLVKKSAIQAVGGFRENLDIQNCEDYLLWTQLLVSGFKLIGISEPLLFYRVHPESSTGQEIKLLFPLTRALLEMPGDHKKPLVNHLEKSFIRLVSMLYERNRIKELKELAVIVPAKTYPKLPSVFWRLAWSVSPKIYLSILWRLKSV